MEIKINKEIRDYKEGMFWGLSLRQFLFSLIGVLVSVGIYFLLRSSIGTEAITWACILGMLPCALLGFVRYNRMPAEKLLWAVIKSKLLTPSRLTYKPQNLYKELCVNKDKGEINAEKKNRKRKH